MPKALLSYTFEGNPPVEIVWTDEDHAAAEAEGWFLDLEDGSIQQEDETSHVSAFDFVRHKATAGSERHIRAMILDAWAAIGAWEDRYREQTGQERDDE